MEKFSLETRIYAGAGAVSALETFSAKRLLLVTDYICGMTDSYAKDLYQELNGIV